MSLKSIILFIKEINEEDKYLIYELLFLLQSEYFLKENQLEKYRSIKDNIGHAELKLHQFMMGKGKTSVFTPLLYFTIALCHNKQPTIITASHLVSDTKKIISLNAYIYNIKINVFSDFEAKKRWVLNVMPKEENKIDFSNEENKIDFSNEYNIIDEFDSHYNYLQSIFNYVTKSVQCLNTKDDFKIIEPLIEPKLTMGGLIIN
jgi:hypothetical protein